MTKKEAVKFENSNIFEGMTSISALINAIKSGKNERKIIKILLTRQKYKVIMYEYAA